MIQKALLAKEEYVNASKNEQEQLENLYSEMKIATNGDIHKWGQKHQKDIWFVMGKLII